MLKRAVFARDRSPSNPRAFGWILVLSATLALVSGCGDASPTETLLPKPQVSALEVTELRAGLTLRASFTAENASSAVLRMQARGTVVARTMESPLENGASTLLLTALEPGVTYDMRAGAATRNDTAWSAPQTITVPPLPADLEDVRFPTNAPAGEFFFMLTSVARPAGNYVLAFDPSGRIVWYLAFETPIGDVQQQTNGHFTIFLSSSTGWQPEPGRVVEVGADGEVLREYRPPEGRYLDPHDLVLRPDGAGGTDAYMITYDIRGVDLTQHGGDASSTAAGHQIVRIDATGAAHTIVDAWTRFTAADWIALPARGLGDIDHPNAIDFAPDGGLLVSWRNLNAVTKHDPVTGEVLWQLGGLQSTLTLEGDPLDGFSGQHFMRAVGPTRILLYDNGTNHVPQETRVVEYEIDAVAQKAKLVWQFRHSPSVFTPFTGSAQRLKDGRTFIGYSNGLCTMVRPDGTVQWEGQLTPVTGPIATYRVLRIPSLVRYEAP